jgi:hypothetical protein
MLGVGAGELGCTAADFGDKKAAAGHQHLPFYGTKPFLPNELGLRDEANFVEMAMRSMA